MKRRVGVVTRVLITSVAALTLLTACTTLNSEQNAVPTAVPSQLEAPPTSTTEAGPSTPSVPVYRATLPPVSPEAAAPTRVSVDWAGVQAAVLPVGVGSDGQMVLPPNPADAGWYRFSAAPSASQGTTVLAAHVDAVGYGVGPFAHLVDVPKGTIITLTDTTGHQIDFRIDSVSLLAKTAIPWRSIFTTAGAHRLVLVTCGGAFNYQTHHYLSNLIITASPS